MIKKLILTEAEREEIFSMHKKHGYRKPLKENIMVSTVQEPSAEVTENMPMGQEDVEATPASKVEDIVNNDPGFQNKIDAIIGALSDEDMAQLQSALSANGIDANTSAEEIHSVIEHPQEDEQDMGENMHNDPKKQIKHKVANILHSVGAGNIAAWGGVPAAMVIGSMTGMPIGFAVSWGATAVLMAIAKKLNQGVEKESMYESKKPINEGLADEAYEFTASSKRISQSLEMLHSFAKQGNMRGANDEKEVLMKHIRRAEYALDAIKRMLR
jgi:uncharacterized membrane protein